MSESFEPVGFSMRRIPYKKEQLELLSHLKKVNGGSISKAFDAACDDEAFIGMEHRDIVRFAEDCDKMLSCWGQPNGHYFEILENE